MVEIVTAIYENGTLRPTQPLNLREQQTVRIQVLPDEPTDAESELDRIIQSLIWEGKVTPPSGQSDVEPMSDQERRALAEEMGYALGKPLSQIILEERGEW
jgi:predicted DNA-binding antitoxin AbrB/MazE fold protein